MPDMTIPARPAPAATTHALTIDQDRAFCTCGWKAEPNSGVTAASRQWGEHLAAVRPVPDETPA